MPLSLNALTTVARVKAVLKKTDSADDSHIENIINAVSAWAETYCARIFLGAYATDITEYPKPYGKFLMLKAYPVRSITSIVDDETTLSYTSETVGDYKYARLKTDGMVELRDGAWSTGMKMIEVKYKGGYENQAALPSDLVYAIDKVCAEIFRSEATAGNVQSERIGDYSVSYSAGEAAHKSGVLGIIDSYKNLTFA